MKRGHCIGIDTHCQFCEIAVVTSNGKTIEQRRTETTISALMPVIEAVPRPRRLVIEEGSLAGWLWRNLRPLVDDMVVSEPRRNRLIYQDGDKDDDIDAEKLANLLRSGMIKPVHQCATVEQAVLKQLVSVYHFRVRQRVREAHRIGALFRQHGVMIRERMFMREEDRAALVKRLPANAMLTESIAWLWQSYDDMVAHEEEWRARLVEAAEQYEVVCRFEALPGFGPIRAATLFVYLDTPWRFRSKAALWKYLGIGLERHGSGNGPRYLGVPKLTHRLIKSTILGAARSAAVQGKNPFADLHRRWIAQGHSAKLARRNVARALAATMWGLWKNGSVYQPKWVSVA